MNTARRSHGIDAALRAARVATGQRHRRDHRRRAAHSAAPFRASRVWRASALNVDIGSSVRLRRQSGRLVDHPRARGAFRTRRGSGGARPSRLAPRAHAHRAGGSAISRHARTGCAKSSHRAPPARTEPSNCRCTRTMACPTPGWWTRWPAPWRHSNCARRPMGTHRHAGRKRCRTRTALRRDRVFTGGSLGMTSRAAVAPGAPTPKKETSLRSRRRRGRSALRRERGWNTHGGAYRLQSTTAASIFTWKSRRGISLACVWDNVHAGKER